MRIPLPRMPRWLSRGLDWVNAPVYGPARRIDVVLAIGGLVCVAWYAYAGGWQGALLGGALYILGVLTALWIL